MTAKTPSIEREKNGRVICTVEFPPERVAPAEEEALRALAANVKVPGFRPGMAPREMLMAKIDRTHLLEETIHRLLPDTLAMLVKEHAIASIASPKVTLKAQEPLTVSIVFVERPKVSVKKVERATLEKTEPKVEERDVERMIAFLMSKHEKAAESDRPAKERDRVTVDFWGADSEGKEIAPIRTQGHPIILGSRTLIPGFEDALLGLKRGDAKSFTLTFPEKYHAAELAGKPVTFHATVTKVEEMTLPELTDAFVQEHLGAASAADLKTKVRESMLAQERRIERQRRENAMLESIRKATTVELVEELVTEETQTLLRNLEEDLRKQNTTLSDWVKSSGKKPEELHRELEERAKQRLILRFGIHALIEQKEITISDTEMEAAVTELLQPLPEQQRKEAAPAYRKGEHAYEQLKWQKKVEKLLNLLLA